LKQRFINLIENLHSISHQPLWPKVLRSFPSIKNSRSKAIAKANEQYVGTILPELSSKIAVSPTLALTHDILSTITSQKVVEILSMYEDRVKRSIAS
jgi:hypothetical protein